MKDFHFSPIQSYSNGITEPGSSRGSFPIITYNHPYLSLQNFTTKRIAGWIDKINKETIRKSALFAGFFPRSFHYMLRKYRPDSYKEDLHDIRFELLETNCKIFEWYTKMNNWLYKLGKPVV